MSIFVLISVLSLWAIPKKNANKADKNSRSNKGLKSEMFTEISVSSFASVKVKIKKKVLVASVES